MGASAGRLRRSGWVDWLPPFDANPPLDAEEDVHDMRRSGMKVDSPIRHGAAMPLQHWYREFRN